MAPVTINYLSIFVAAVAQMALGMFWYSPAGFGKPWMSLMGLSPDQMAGKKEGMGKKYALNALGALVMAYVLAHFIFYVGATTLTGGLQAGFWLWLGFVATVSLGGVLWENKPWKLYALNTGFQLAGLLLMGGILAVWK